MSRTFEQALQDLERRKQELLAQLVPHKRHVSRSIFAIIRAGLASQLHALLQSKLFTVNERDYNECTPLHIAAHEGRQDMVKILISCDADPFATDGIGRTPLDLAVANRHANIARYLLVVMKQKHKQQLAAATNAVQPTLHQQSSSHSLPDPSSALAAMPTPEASPESHDASATPNTILLQEQEATVAEWSTSGVSGIMHRMLPADFGSSAMAFGSTPATEFLFPATEEADDSKVNFSQYSTISDNISLVVCMVGLPGRGKSFISKRISRYLNWKGVPCRVFNAGNYRRQMLGVNETAQSDFYDPGNKAAKEAREHMAQLASEDLVKFLGANPVAVGILDATNTTVERRQHLIHYFAEMQRNVLRKPVRVLFVESVCTDERIITENILRAKCGNDDFKHVSDTAAVVSEFRERIKQYEKVYEPIQLSEGVSFIKIENVKQHIILNRIEGGLASRIVFFLMNLHPVAFPVFIATNSETEGNRDGVFGGSGRLTDKGRETAQALKQFVADRCDCYSNTNFVVLHGTNPYVMDTIAPLKEYAERQQCGIELVATRCLDDINFGKMNGDSIPESVEKHPKRTAILYASSMGSAAKDAIADERIRRIPTPGVPIINYCVQFPAGESCRQVNVRLESALMTIMRSSCSVLVVAPPIPAQGVLAFFSDIRPELSPCIEIPKHHVVEIHKGEAQLYELSTEKET